MQKMIMPKRMPVMSCSRATAGRAAMESVSGPQGVAPKREFSLALPERGGSDDGLLCS